MNVAAIAFLIGLALGIVVGAFANEVGWWLAFYERSADE